jgi:cytochrome c556
LTVPAVHAIVIGRTPSRVFLGTGIRKIFAVFTPCPPARAAGAEKINPPREQEMIRTALAVVVLAFGATALVAQSDPIAARKALMKSNGDHNRIATEMLEGKRPFDLAEAKKVFVVFVEAGEKAPALFPDNSKTGGDTAALPPIWENKADFNAKLAKFAAEAKAAGDATKDLDSFKAQITEVRKNCGGCHQTYRKRTS